MLILVYARNHLRDSIGEVTTASVACGVLGVGGNKGAVAVEFSLHRRRLAVLCSHFAAHQVRGWGVFFSFFLGGGGSRSPAVFNYSARGIPSTGTWMCMRLWQLPARPVVFE